MASPTQWTWVWANSGSRWWTGKHGVMHSMGSQRAGHDWMTELTWAQNNESINNIKKCLFGAALGLCCCTWVCGERAGPPLEVHRYFHCGGFSCWGLEVVAHGFSSTDSAAVRHGLSCPLSVVGSSQIRDWTCVPCLGRRILHHWASREAQ